MCDWCLISFKVLHFPHGFILPLNFVLSNLLFTINTETALIGLSYWEKKDLGVASYLPLILASGRQRQGISVSSRMTWSTQLVPGHSGQCHRRLFQYKKTKFQSNIFIIIFTFIYSFIYLNVFSVHWCKGIRFPGTGVTDNYDLPYWELNPGPMEAHPLQPLSMVISQFITIDSYPEPHPQPLGPSSP